MATRGRGSAKARRRQVRAEAIHARPQPAQPVTPPTPGRLRQGVRGAGRLVALGACVVGAFFATKVTIAAYWVASGLEGGQAAFWWILTGGMALAALFMAREAFRNYRALRAMRGAVAETDRGTSG